MKTLLILISMLFVFSGCTLKNTTLKVLFEDQGTSGKEGDQPTGDITNLFLFYAPGFGVTTATDQKADGQLQVSLTPLEKKVIDSLADVFETTTIAEALSSPAPAETPKPAEPADFKQFKLTPYETGIYEDGRARYLFRTTMAKLPKTVGIVLNNKLIYEVNITGDRWEYDGRYKAILKNSDGRVESVTLLLPEPKGNVILVGAR